MIAIGTREQGARTRRRLQNNQDFFYKSEWMAAGEYPEVSPTIFLIEQEPNVTLGAHFHKENQFQLFVHGTGRIGNHPISPGTIHYAGSHTGYGPLVAGAEGLHYFTIRPKLETGAYFLPAKEHMRPGPKRGGNAGPVEMLPAETLAGTRTTTRDDLIAMAPDGLGVTAFTVAPNDIITYQRSPAAEGVFIVVLNGELAFEDGVLGKWESMFVQRTDSFPSLRATQSGSQVVCLSVPPKDPRYL